MAAGAFEVSGWIPYWATDGPKDARKHLDELSEAHPFSHSVKSDGSLLDLAGLTEGEWKKLIAAARKEGVPVTPTIMTSNGDLVHTLLSNDAKRARHIVHIITLVEDGGYDGINIDYEGKRAETKDYFSLFLKELKAALGEKRLSCAIEARTPPESLYRIVPDNIQYANDYAEIAKHCDRVQIMGYDQQRADITLNDARRGLPYMPVSDPEWVRKVITLALETIPKEKLVLGIPTYGHEYEVLVSPEWFHGYTRVRAVNPDTAKALAKKQKVKTSRTSASEQGFTYPTKATDARVKKYKVPKGTPRWASVAAQALAYANATSQSTTFNFVSWNDAEAVKQKIALAREFNLAGVAIFKIDGGEDQRLWALFEE